MGLVLAYLKMLPRLTAEDELTGVRIAQLGASARFEFADMKSYLRTVEDQMNPDRRRPRAAKASPETLAAMGIGVRTARSEAALSDV